MKYQLRSLFLKLTLAVSYLIGIGSICCVKAEADLVDISGLSNDALNSLVAHYNGRKNVSTTGAVVDSWTPVDAFGNALGSMAVSSTQRGNGAAELITYDGFGTLSFDDTAASGDGRYLSGALSNSNSTEFTVIWLGHYDSGAPFENSGVYAFNIGLNDLAHQRDNGGGGFVVELYNGSSFAGDDITALDGFDTVWSTVVTANSHLAFANGSDLNVSGTPSYNISANADMVMGAFGSSGFDLVGDISQMVIFESALSDSDRVLIENYLASVPEPSSVLALTCLGLGLVFRRKRIPS